MKTAFLCARGRPPARAARPTNRFLERRTATPFYVHLYLRKLANFPPIVAVQSVLSPRNSGPLEVNRNETNGKRREREWRRRRAPNKKWHRSEELAPETRDGHTHTQTQCFFLTTIKFV